MPTETPDLFDAAQKFVVALRDKYIAAKADGQLTFAEAVGIGNSALRFLVDQAELLNLPGVEKKKLVLDAFKRVYDLLAPLIDIPYVPDWIESKAIKPWFRGIVIMGIDKVIDNFAEMLPEHGKKNPTEGAA